MSDTAYQDTDEEASAQDEKYRDIHARAMVQFDRIQTALYAERQLCREDRRFVTIPGAQYEGPLFTNFDNKPMIEINKTQMSQMRLEADYRQNRIDVKFVSKDGTDTTKLADTCNGLHRADMQDSQGRLALDNAFSEASKGGIGAYRLTTVYEDEEDPDNEHQRIRYEAIYDADTSVYFDLDAKRQDKADAMHCFVLYSMTIPAFEEEFDGVRGKKLESDSGKHAAASMPKNTPWFNGDWYGPDVVYIAEYYLVEEKREELQIWVNVGDEEERYWTRDFKDDPELEGRLIAEGSRLVHTRRIKRRQVCKYLISGSEVLRDCGVIAGKYIPIIPIYGNRTFIDNIERCWGHVRYAKDAQRLYNMLASKWAEMSALASASVPIFFAEQILGYENLWANANLNMDPYRVINKVEDAQGTTIAGPIGYTKAPEIPQVQAALVQLVGTDLKEVLGSVQEQQAIPGNIATQTLETLYNRLDVNSFMYMDNMAIGERWDGEVWLSMAREVYVEKGRKMKVVGPQNEVSSIELMKPTVDANSHATVYENDLTEADFDVVSDVGPASSTKRMALIRSLTELLAKTVDPEAQKVLIATIMMNTENEGMSDINEYFRKQLVQMGAAKPTDEEAKAMAEAKQNAPPDANQEYLKAAANEANAKAEESRVNSLKTLAEVEKIRADAEQSNAKTIQILEAVQLSMDQSRQEMEALRAAVAMPQTAPPPAPSQGAP